MVTPNTDQASLRRLAHLSRGGTHLCDLCRGINVQTLSTPGGYRHTSIPRSMFTSAEHCPLCEIFILREANGSYYNVHSCATGPLFCSLTGNWGFKKLLLSTETWSTTGFWGHIRSGKLISRHIFTDAGDAATAYGVAVRRPVNDTSSVLSTEIARQWVRTCLEEHGCSHWLASSRSVDQLRVRPARLIDVTAFGSDSMDAQLVDGSNISVYVTLSHCWGKEPVYKTTPGNIPEHMVRIRYERLPATFRDAIGITRNLGYTHIWIDALCIVQGSEEDWASEGSKMEAIFSNCVLCISATSGTDSLSGCYSRTATGRTNIDDYVIELPSVLSTGSRSTLYVYYPQPFEYEYSIWPAAIRDSPATTRGWMLQERLLAPRILHFTSEQLIWECCTGFKSEDGLESWALAISAGSEGTNHHDTGPKLAHELANASGALTLFEILWKWYNDVISVHYSKRLLSFGQDKLPAISGLARLVARSTKSRYIAGLWESGLCFGLCWRVDAPAPPLPTQEEYRAPSFSWASLDSPVSWEPDIYNNEVPPPLFTMLSLDSEPATSDRFGRVSRAALRVKGRVKQFRVCPLKHDLENYGPIKSYDPNAYFSASPEDYLSSSQAWLDTEPQDETLLGMLVCEAHKGAVGDEETLYLLLLTPAIGRPDVFKRRGLAAMPESEAYDCVVYPGEYREEIITLI